MEHIFDDIYNLDSLSELEAKTIAHQFLIFRRQMEDTGKNGKMAPVYRIFISLQIKLEKNGFHRLTDWQFDFPTKF